jgi:Na+-driven multidrug efflux pump
LYTYEHHYRLWNHKQNAHVCLVPILGITQGFLPVAGYNYGAQNYNRVTESISIKYAALLASIIFNDFILCYYHSNYFTDDTQVLAEPLMPCVVFAVSPYYGAINWLCLFSSSRKAKALLLTLSKQGFFLIPLVLILPNFLVFLVWSSSDF